MNEGIGLTIKVKLIRQGIYRSIALIVTMVAVGCVPVWTKSTGAKYSIIEDGKTFKTRIVEEFGSPDTQTLDGRFFLYTFNSHVDVGKAEAG